ncbi:MAG: ferritin [Ignavibacteriaceae bacterium]|nr:ferritin [Ignavibacteriaceae bacterium]
MLKEKILKILNKQVNEELFSSYLYLSMSAYFSSINFEGFAKWMSLQSKEEYEHAMKIYNYILQRDGKVTLTKIETPKTSWSSALNVFQETLKHEQHITACIHNIVNMAIQEKDHATTNFFQWFVTEQVEEVATAGSILEKIKMIGDSKNGLFILDRELGQRQ